MPKKSAALVSEFTVNSKSGVDISFYHFLLGQCENGIFTFEKVTGHFLRSARQELLNAGKMTSATSRELTGGITVDCGKACLEMGADCPAYSIDYAQVRKAHHL